MITIIYSNVFYGIEQKAQSSIYYIKAGENNYYLHIKYEMKKIIY